MHASPKNRVSMLVTFSGIDGAGKSTQIAHLRAHFQEVMGLRVDLITFWDDVARFKRIRDGVGHKVFKGDKGVGTPEAPIQRRDKNIRSPLMTFIRMAIYLVDVLSLRDLICKVLRSDADVVIFDRYIYDELANLDLWTVVGRWYVRGIMTLVRRPEISFVLDADPAQAYIRKPEYPLQFLYTNRSSYIKLSQLVGGIIVIPPVPLEQATAEIVRRVQGVWFAHHSQSDGAKDSTEKETIGTGT